VLRVASVDGHSSDCLVQFEASHALAELIDGSDEIPTRRVGHTRRFGMDALARQDVWQADARRQHLHPYLACLWVGEFFFDNGDHFRAAIASDDNSFVTHIPDPVFRSYKSARRSIQMPKSPTPRTSFPRSTRRRAS